MKTPLLTAIAALLLLDTIVTIAAEPIDIGSRLELMIDEHLVASTSGGIHLQLHKPVRRNVVLVTDRPWEGNACTYTSVFQDGKRFRMYFGSYHYVTTEGKLTAAHRQYTSYVESRDGIHSPSHPLGLVALQGSKQNNIVSPYGDSSAVFRDDSAPPEERYKMFDWDRLHDVPEDAEPNKKYGLYGCVSPDGYSWTRLPAPLLRYFHAPPNAPPPTLN